jgi:hypothetical protein
MREKFANYNYFCCPSLLCPYDHIDIWSYGHMVIWTYGHVDIWTFRHMDIKTYGHVDIWTYGHKRDREEKFRSLVQNLSKHGAVKTYMESLIPK